MQDKISALMDSELNPEEAAAVVDQFRKTDALREQWALYHLISDSLGQSEVKHFDITRRVGVRLANEPDIPALRTPRLSMKHKPIAYAVAASIAAVAVAGWMSLQTMQPPELALQNMAQNNPVAVTAVPAITTTVSAPAQINDYLLAHREFSPSTSVHGVAPYMRTATESHQNFAR
ncbi:MAG: sigma-E factor negative regulatory protein [Nitrosospira sp.]